MDSSVEKQHSKALSTTQSKEREPKPFLTSQAAASQLICVLQFGASSVVPPCLQARTPYPFHPPPLSDCTENFPVPNPRDENQGRRFLNGTRSFSHTSTERETGNMHN